MCFHKSIKYTCAHTFFTICIRTCHVQDEYLIDPEGCTPCDIKTSHALYTIAVGRRCDACLRLDARVGDMKAVLKGARAKVDEMSAIRDSANELLERNDKEVLEKGAGIGACVRTTNTTGIMGEDKLRCESIGMDSKDQLPEEEFSEEELPNLRSSW